MEEKITYVSARKVSKDKILIEIWKGGEKIIFSTYSPSTESGKE
jgi:hypothetical protein